MHKDKMPVNSLRLPNLDLGLVGLSGLAILTTFGWTLGVAVIYVTCVPIYFSSFAFGKAAIALVAASIAGWFQWLVIQQRIPVRRGHWLKATALGLASGFVLGGLLFGNAPNIQWPDNLTQYSWENWLGWTVYSPKVFAVAGMVLGLSQWYVLRRIVKNTGWLSFSGLIGGFMAGGVEGYFIDDCIQGFGDTTNGLGERMVCGGLIGFPIAMTLFGAIMGMSLVLVLLQSALQKRKRPGTADQASGMAYKDGNQ